MGKTLIVSNTFDFVKLLGISRDISTKQNKLSKKQLKSSASDSLEVCSWDEYLAQDGVDNYILNIEHEDDFKQILWEDILKSKATYYWLFNRKDNLGVFEATMGFLAKNMTKVSDDNYDIKNKQITKKQLLPKYKDYSTYFARLFVNIDSEQYVFKESIRFCGQIYELMPEDTPQELMNILLKTQEEQFIPNTLSIKNDIDFYGFTCEQAFVFNLRKAKHYVLCGFKHNIEDCGDNDIALDIISHEEDIDSIRSGINKEDVLILRELYDEAIQDYLYDNFIIVAKYIDSLLRYTIIRNKSASEIINKIGDIASIGRTDIYMVFDVEDKENPLKYFSIYAKKQIITVEKNVNHIYYPEIYALFKTYPGLVGVNEIEKHANAYRKYHGLPGKKSQSKNKQDSFVKAIDAINTGFNKTKQQVEDMKYTLPKTLININKDKTPHRFTLCLGESFKLMQSSIAFEKMLYDMYSWQIKRAEIFPKHEDYRKYLSTISDDIDEKQEFIRIKYDIKWSNILSDKDLLPLDLFDVLKKSYDACFFYQAEETWLNIESKMKKIYEVSTKRMSGTKLELGDMYPYFLEEIIIELSNKKDIDNFSEYIIDKYTGSRFGKIYSKIKNSRYFKERKTISLDVTATNEKKDKSNNQGNDSDIEFEILLEELLDDFKPMFREVLKTTRGDAEEAFKVIQKKITTQVKKG